VCSFTYNRICALRVDYCAQSEGAILTYDQQMFTSDDLQNTNLVEGKYTAPESGQYSVNFWTKGFTSGGKVELYHNDKKIEWNKQNVYDQYHADVALSAGDILYIWIRDMKQCQGDDSAWRLLNSVFCIEPTGIHSSTRQFKFKDGAWSNYSSTSTTTTTSDTSDTVTTSSTTSCPAGYAYKEGDIPGWGQLKGRIETTMEGCSDECSNQAGCCSYEYSYSSGLCNLNKDCEPTVGKYKDYLFCTKGMKNLTPLHSVPAEVTTTTLQSPTTSIEVLDCYEDDVNYAGQDFAVFDNVDTPYDCDQRCHASESCLVWTWLKQSVVGFPAKRCFLKNKIPNKTQLVGVVSALRDCSS